MVQNINNTRSELKKHTKVDIFRGHRKQDSKASSTGTSTDTQSESIGRRGDIEIKEDLLTPASSITEVVDESTDKNMTTESFPRPDRLHLGGKGKRSLVEVLRGLPEAPECQPILQSPPASITLS